MTTTWPWASARHCVSTCRGRSRYRSTKHSPRPNAAVASRTADSYCPSTSSSRQATLRPRPPPPNAALIATGIAVPGPERPDLPGVAHRVRGPRGQRRAGLAGDVPGPHLVAERLDRLRRRADPGQARPGDRPGEVGVLREEPVAGVHRVRPGLQRHRDDLVDVQVGLRAGRPGQRIRLVCHLDVQRVQVGFGVHRDAGQAGVTARPDDTHRDLAAVRDQDLAQRRPPWFYCAGV